MSSYKVLPPYEQSGYMVDVVTDEGSHHTMLGFETEAEAQAWVEADQKLDRTFHAAPSPA